ncbi:hypothetical protein [Vibrio phage vB_VmeM-Yong XC32]|nr:hypothetical protein [Vibrio phage vB_VmeM-Yong XC31]QAX96426.1 hypothetical protein [Vibrio phage vB_VmeM-Yong XC32]QAX96743.1 hypothetical protein [Vibrio phage vB_VmeM-Yong MS31]QAX97062.1 hypothetical protein [Vibrio phage vB_VmeM-Yong MS32]
MSNTLSLKGFNLSLLLELQRITSTNLEIKDAISKLTKKRPKLSTITPNSGRATDTTLTLQISEAKKIQAELIAFRKEITEELKDD